MGPLYPHAQVYDKDSDDDLIGALVLWCRGIGSRRFNLGLFRLTTFAVVITIVGCVNYERWRGAVHVRNRTTLYPRLPFGWENTFHSYR